MAKSNKDRNSENSPENRSMSRTRRFLNRLLAFIDSFLRLKIRGKLGIAFVGFSALPTLILGIFAWQMISKFMKEASVRDLSHLAEVINIRLKDFTEVVKMDQQFIIKGFQAPDINNNTVISDASLKTIIEKQALDLMRTRPRYAGITFLVDSLKGEWISLHRSLLDQERITTRPGKYSWHYYRLLVEDLPGEKMRLTPVEHIDPETRNTFAAFSFAMPYRNDQGNLEGILVTDIFADQIFSIIETTLGKTIHYTAGIVDNDGHYLYHSIKKQNWNQLIAESSIHNLQYDFTQDLVNEIISDIPGAYVTEQSDVFYCLPLEMGATELNQKYFFYLAQPGAVIFAPLRRFSLIFLALAVVFILIALVLSRVATRRFVDPIQRLQDGSDIISQGNLAHRIQIDTGDEIEHLAEKFNYMAKSIQERDQQLKDYSTHLEEQIAERTRELQDEKDKLRIILDNIPSTLILNDYDHHILAASSAIHQLTGYKATDVLGRKCYDIINLPQLCEHCVFNSAVGRRGPMRKEYTVKRKDGQNRTLEVISVPVQLTSGEEAYLEMLSDITHRVRLQNQLLQSEKLASMGEMAAVLAHEIRNSLTAADMLLQLIHESESLEPADKESLEVVLSSTSRINKITNDLLSFARPALLDKQTVDPKDLIRESVEFYKQHFENRNIQTEVQLPHDLPKICVDYNLLSEVLVNILLNAYQAVGSDGQVLITAEVISADDPLARQLEFNIDGNGRLAQTADHKPAPEKHLIIRVQDDGPGIPSTNLEKIFDPFYTTKIDGTGLGLSMAKRVVEAHGGGIYANSKNGKGVTITIIIPQDTEA